MAKTVKAIKLELTEEEVIVLFGLAKVGGEVLLADFLTGGGVLCEYSNNPHTVISLVSRLNALRKSMSLPDYPES